MASLTGIKNSLQNSYEVIIMAHPGATLAVLGKIPRNSPEYPSSAIIVL